jgi:rod shape-determining protein MreD
MKRSVAFFIFGVFFLLFQVSFLSHLVPFVPRPNLVLIILVYLAVGSDSIWALSWTACMGFLFDVLSGGPFGLFSFEFLVLHIVIRGVSRALVLQRPAFQAGVVLLSHFLQTLFFATILALLGLPFPGEIFQAGQLLLSSLIAAFLGLPLFVLLERIDHPPVLIRLD